MRAKFINELGTVQYRPKFKSINPIVGAGLIAGGSSLLGGLTSGLFGQSAASQQFAWQKQLSQQQFEYQKKLMAIQQSYNSPASQAMQMRMAGLNPAKASNPGSPVGLGEVSQGSAVAPDMSGVGSAIAGAGSAVASASVSLADTNLKLTQQKKDELDFQLKFDTYKEEVAMTIQRYENMLKEGKVLDATEEKLLSDARMAQKNIDAFDINTHLANAYTRSQTELNNIRVVTELINAKIAQGGYELTVERFNTVEKPEAAARVKSLLAYAYQCATQGEFNEIEWTRRVKDFVSYYYDEESPEYARRFKSNENLDADTQMKHGIEYGSIKQADASMMNATTEQDLSSSRKFSNYAMPIAVGIGSIGSMLSNILPAGQAGKFLSTMKKATRWNSTSTRPMNDQSIPFYLQPPQ